MRRLFSDLCFIAAGLLALILFAQSPRAQFNSFPPGVFTGRAALDAGSAPPAYTGPGDIVAGAKAFWSTSSCYSAAYAGSVALIADNATGLTTTTIGCSSGVVSVTGGSPLAATCSSACNYVTMFDQSGALACAGSTACDLTNATPSSQMTLLSNSINTSSCASIASGLSLISANNFTLPQPFTVAMISERTGGTGNIFGVVHDAGSGSGTIRAGYNNAVNKAGMFNGNSIVTGAAASDNSAHSLIYVFADATQSVIYVDGSGTNQSLGGTTGFSGAAVAMGSNGAGETGFACEASIWGNDIGSTNAASLSTNGRARYGSF